jgi:hypothetical protein
MLRLAWREGNPRNRRKLLVTLWLWVPLVASLHAICFFLDPILFPRLRRVTVQAPIFIVGHARSGTTLLHRLLSKDGDRFSAFLLYELFLPSLLEKKALRALAAADARWFGGFFERHARAWEARKFGKTQDVHAMGLTQPEEDDGIYTYSCASGSWIVRLPYLGALDFYHVDERPPRERRRMLRFYHECVRRQLLLNGPEKIHLSKNPTFSGRIESLIEEFPDARFVIPFRHPYETIPSLLKLLQLAWRMRKWSDAEMQRSLRVLAEQSFHTYTYPLEVLERHPETPRAIVDYRALVAEPRRTVEAIYAQLGLSMTPSYAAALAVEEEKARRHETSHAYGLGEFGLRADEIHARLAPLFERFHWEDVKQAGAASPEVG